MRFSRVYPPTGKTISTQYSYNAANQISEITNKRPWRTFGYDALDRLTWMIASAGNESYAYDAVGNRTASHLSTTYSYQPFNRLTSAQTGTYIYDANGNKCGCKGNQWNDEATGRVGRFAAVPTYWQGLADVHGNVAMGVSSSLLADPDALSVKARILGVQR
jgi:YD repeat-containing protein